MSFELKIARRYIRSKRRTGFISTITYISFFGIMLGVAVLTIVMSVMNGFENEVKSRFIANDSDVRIRTFGERPFAIPDSLDTKLAADSLVAEYTPYIESFGMIKGEYTEGALVRGVDEETIGGVIKVKEQMIAGEFYLSDELIDYPGIVLGKGLADRLAVVNGDKIRIISPAISSTFAQPPVKTFIVTGVFETGIADIDAGLCYISIKSAQELFKMRGKVNGLALKLSSLKNTDKVKSFYNKNLEYPFFAISWKDMHKTLFSWMQLEKLLMGVLLSLIVLIAAFNILSSLIMVVLEKKRDIGILLAMGATKSSISKIFIYQGLLIGIVGTVFGIILGFIVCVIQLEYKLLSLPGDIYIINALPIMIKWSDFLIIAVASVFLTFISTIYPSKQASKTDVAEILRNE